MATKKLPDWDLSHLYKTVSDPAIEQDLNFAESTAKKFNNLYRGRISTLTDIKLAKALVQYEKITELMTKPNMFGFLLFSMDSSKPAVGAFYQKIKVRTTKIAEHVIFFELELLTINNSKFKKLIDSNKLKNYKRYLEILFKQKKHRLSEKEEVILAQKSLTSRSAFVRLFDQLAGQRRFKFEYKGKKFNLQQTEILNLRLDKDRGLRKAASESFTAGLKEASEINTYILNVLIQDTELVEKLTNFTSLAQSRHEDNEIEESTVELMCKTVFENKHIIQDYLKIKAKSLGLKQLKFYDTIVPVHQNNKKITFDEMRKTISHAFKAFHPKYEQMSSEFFSQNRIDAPVRAGKSGGAFCMSASPNTPPYILINFDGKSHDVATLAHELGHGINGELMRKQTVLNYNNPTILAEVASLFSEFVLFDYQMTHTSELKQKSALLAEKIEDLAGNIFRGVSVFKFEYAIHKASRENGELTTEQFNKIWIESQQNMYGQTIDTTGGYEYWWSYIAHLYHFSPPFYYYGYAFGAITALALYSQYKSSSDKDVFLDKYFEFLSSGSTVSPEEKLKKFGFDINSAQYWNQATSVLKDMLSEFKNLQGK
jgi:oligoendopeptidase F